MCIKVLKTHRDRAKLRRYNLAAMPENRYTNYILNSYSDRSGM